MGVGGGSSRLRMMISQANCPLVPDETLGCVVGLDPLARIRRFLRERELHSEVVKLTGTINTYKNITERRLFKIYLIFAGT